MIAAKGKKVTEIDYAKEPEALAAVALGPTGNLRAPSIKIGKTWLIGFNEAEYGKALG